MSLPPFIASLALGLAALPALDAAPQAHAATARQVAHGQGGTAKHAKLIGAQAPVVQTFLPIPFPAPTTSIVVTNCTTAGLNSLSTALQTSATISFNCAPGGGSHVINLGDTFKVTNGEVLTIDGSDGGRNDIVLTGGATVVSGIQCNNTSNPSTNGHQLFYVSYGSSLTLNNLTLTDGYAYSGDSSGGAVEAFGDFHANRDTFRSNGALDYGGALELATDSSTRTQTSTVTNSTFDSNYTNCDTGGAIDLDSRFRHAGPQQVTLTNDTFTNNTTYDDYGGAIYGDNNYTTSGLTIANSVFRDNLADNGDNGGAIATYDQNLRIANTLFSRNHATDEGGAVYLGQGGLQTAYPTSITNSTFVENRVDNGNGDGYGGAIYTEVPLTVTNTTITANSSYSDGSAIYDGADGTSGPVTVAASTINANVSDTSVSGDYNGAALVNATGDGTFAIGTSIVYDNTTLNQQVPDVARPRANVVPAGTVVECAGDPTPPMKDLGSNLSDYDTKNGTTNSCGFKQATPGTPSPDILVPVGTDSAIGLGPLGAYGGPILGALGSTSPTYTERLTIGSPAIDAVPTGVCVDANGAPLPTDQRGAGFVRPYVAACDIGAFEVSYLGSTTCSVAITFFSGGTAFGLRTGSALNTLMSYLSIKGSGGTITAVPLVPRAGVPSTLSCTVPDPNAPVATPPASAVTVTVDAQVVYSTNPSVARLSTVRVVATRTATTETVTVSAINPVDNSTGATLYTLTPFVQPQSFVIRVGIPTLFQFPLLP